MLCSFVLTSGLLAFCAVQFHPRPGPDRHSNTTTNWFDCICYLQFSHFAADPGLCEAALKRGLSFDDFKPQETSSAGVCCGTVKHEDKDFGFALQLINTPTDIENERKARSQAPLLAENDNIARLFGVTACGKARISELCDGDLPSLLDQRIDNNPFFADSPDDMLIVASDLLYALKDMHRCGVLHLKVSARAVLYVVQDNAIRLKLADLGQCQPVKSHAPLPPGAAIDTAATTGDQRDDAM